MENKANYTVVGAIATAVLVAFVGFVFWFAGPSSNTATARYEVIFTGTVSGLSAGTEVQFNGIKIGQVKAVALDPADINRVIAGIEIDASIPIKADTKALMGFQGLTGVGSLQLSGGTEQAGPPPIEPGRSVPTLYAKVSDFQSILDGLSTTINGTATAVDRLNGFLDANDAKLNETISNVAAFSDALAANADGVKDALASIADAGKQVGPMAEQIGDLSIKLAELAEAIPPEKVTEVVNNIADFSDTLSRNSGKVDAFFTAASTLADDVTKMSATLSQSVDRIDAVTAAADPAVVRRVLDNIDAFATKLGDNSTNVDTIVANATEISHSLTGSATRVDEILAKLDASVSNAEGEGLFAQIGDAAVSIQQLADQLNTSTASIAVGLNNFTSSGLPGYAALAAEARATLARFDRVVRNLESNPQGLIFGGETVREYNKR